MQHNNEWDRALKITADGRGLIGHAGAVLLRKAADQAGLTAQLSGAMRVKGSSPLLDRGIVLVSMAVAIALGATSMSDIALLAHLAPLLGTAPSGPTVRRALDLAGDKRTRDRIARARARARSRAWDLAWQASCGFPWLEVAGKTLTGWVVIDMDATLVTAHSEKENAAPTWKKGYGLLTERRDVTAAQKAKLPWQCITTLTGMSRSAGRTGRDLDLGATESGHTAPNGSPASSSLLLVSTSPTWP